MSLNRAVDPNGKYLVCWRVADLAVPQADSVKGYFCVYCGCEVWVKPKNLPLRMTIACRRCLKIPDDFKKTGWVNLQPPQGK